MYHQPQQHPVPTYANPQAPALFDRSKVELFFSCRSLPNLDTLSKTDCQLKIFQGTIQGGWVESGRTEIINDNLNPDFAKSIVTDYIFEQTQKFRVDAIDDDGNGKFETIGSAIFELGELMGSKNNLLILHLMRDLKTMKKSGQLIVRSEEVCDTNATIFFEIDCQSLNFGGCCGGAGKSFLVLYKPRYDKGNEDSRADWLKVFQTPVSVQASGSPKWPKFQLSSSKLCSSDYSRRLKCEWWEFQSNGSHILKGQVEFSVAEIKGSSENGKW
jgi:hypothetical protein